MTSQTAKRVSESQPAIILATVLAALCLNQHWPAVVAIFFVMQLGIILTALGTRHGRLRQASGIRFLARAVAISPQTTGTSARFGRPHLHLVP
jgi:hypothetical protein